MPRPASDVRSRILTIVDRQLRRAGAREVTIESVAREAGCAKGLVHYHYRTKSSLYAAAAKHLLSAHEARWKDALQATNAQAAIDRSWQLIMSEASTGFWRAWISLAASTDHVIGQLVNNGVQSLAQTLASSVARWLREMGLVPTVTVDELGKLLAAAVQGLGLQLSTGADPERLEGAYAALWAGILGLTRPERR